MEKVIIYLFIKKINTIRTQPVTMIIAFYIQVYRSMMLYLARYLQNMCVNLLWPYCTHTNNRLSLSNLTDEYFYFLFLIDGTHNHSNFYIVMPLLGETLSAHHDASINFFSFINFQKTIFPHFDVGLRFIFFFFVNIISRNSDAVIAIFTL